MIHAPSGPVLFQFLHAAMAAPKLMEPVLYEQWRSVLLLRHCFSLNNNSPPLKPLPASHHTVWRCSLDQISHDATNLPRSPQIPSVHLSEPHLLDKYSSIRNFKCHSYTRLQSKNISRGPNSFQYLVNSAQHSLKRTNSICLTATREPLYLCVSLGTLNAEKLLREQPRHENGKDERDSESQSVSSSTQLDSLLAKLLNSTSQFSLIPVPLQPCSVPSDIMVHSGRTGSEMMNEILRRNRTEEHLVHVCSTRTHQAEAEAQQPSPHPSKDKPTPAQLSYILLKLREELPAFFDGHHSFGMYAPNMVFENSLTRHAWTTTGCSSYQLFLTSVRLALCCSFSQLHLDLLKITKEVEGGRIEARWRVRGRPRLGWKMQKRVILDGFSTFVVNSEGLITLHKIDKVMPSHKEKSRVLSWMAQMGVLLKLSTHPPSKLEPQPP